MDADGAHRLALAIAHHEHWRRAAAVRAGHQPARDPDATFIHRVGRSVRVYRPPAGSGAPLERRLIDGWWVVTRSAP